jgi:hypothetical protein
MLHANTIMLQSNTIMLQPNTIMLHGIARARVREAARSCKVLQPFRTRKPVESP